MGKVLGRGAGHRRPADVDGLDQLGQLGGAPACLVERVQIDDDQVDRADSVRVDLGPVGVDLALVEDAAMHTRMQRLDPPVEDLRETGDRVDRGDLESSVAQAIGGAAGRDDFDVVTGQRLAELDQTVLVEHADQRAANAHRFTRGGGNAVLGDEHVHESPW